MRALWCLLLFGCGRVDFDPRGDIGEPFELMSHGHHSCVLRGTQLACWGDNDFGQLGFGDTVARTPTILPGVWDHVWVGEYDTCAREASGGATWCWGDNDYEQATPGQSGVPTSPMQTSLPTGIDYIAFGEAHACAVSAGTVQCWGHDLCGQIAGGAGDGSIKSPTIIPGLANVATVAAHDTQSCSLDTAGAVTCWGTWDAINTAGPSTCGTPIAGAPAVIPLPAPAISIQGSCHGHTCVALATGDVWCWGSNDQGGVGDGTIATATMPTRVATFGPGLEALEVTTGAFFTCARTASSVWCWGQNDSGELGDGGGPDQHVPERITFFDGRAVDHIDSGCFHTCARADGELYCWGRNANHEVGVGTTTQPTPILIPLP